MYWNYHNNECVTISYLYKCGNEISLVYNCEIINDTFIMFLLKKCEFCSSI